jgi:hypothetical protein
MLFCICICCCCCCCCCFFFFFKKASFTPTHATTTPQHEGFFISDCTCFLVDLFSFFVSSPHHISIFFCYTPRFHYSLFIIIVIIIIFFFFVRTPPCWCRWCTSASGAGACAGEPGARCTPTTPRLPGGGEPGGVFHHALLCAGRSGSTGWCAGCTSLVAAAWWTNSGTGAAEARWSPAAGQRGTCHRRTTGTLHLPARHTRRAGECSALRCGTTACAPGSAFCSRRGVARVCAAGRLETTSSKTEETPPHFGHTWHTQHTHWSSAHSEEVGECRW